MLDVALVSLMAPAAVLGGVSKAAMSTGALAKALAGVPSAFFEASVPVGSASHTSVYHIYTYIYTFCALHSLPSAFFEASVPVGSTFSHKCIELPCTHALLL